MRIIRIMGAARRQIPKERNWWRRHRDKAPAAFDEDLDFAMQLIAENPMIGVEVPARKKGVRRLTLQRTGHYIYYARRADDSIEILALWHSSRRPPPSL